MKIRRPSLSFAARTTAARALSRLMVPAPATRGPGLPRLVAGALLAVTAGCAPTAGGDPEPAPIVAQQAAITVEPGEVACWKSCDVLRAYVRQYCLDRGATLNAAKFLCGVAPRLGGGGGGPCERPDGTPPFWIGGRVGFEPTCAATVPQAPDRDADGIPDSRDACPAVAGVASSDPTRNGCPPPPCDVVTNRELIMTDLSVVEDATRTRGSGAWTFKKLMEDMAPTAGQAPAMVEAMLNTWLAPQTINGFVVPARSAMSTLVLDRWPRVNGQLDLSRAPLRLLAIVNRPDLRNLAAGKAGEGRFVFGVLDGPTDPNNPAAGNPTQFTLILEYNLPAQAEADVQRWANDWHALGALPFPSAQYNAALEAITSRFAGRNAAPGRPNGSALSQLRTNEIALGSPWELRELVLSPATGLLVPDTVKVTPDLSFDGSARLGRFINANEAAILAETHDVPATFEGAPFLAGSSLNNLNAFRALGVTNNEARHKFSLNTCSGCHGTEETGTSFLHINPRAANQVAGLSGFMTGITRSDPVSGQSRTFNDLERRRLDLRSIVCPSTQSLPGGRLATPNLSKGIGRVH